MNRLRQDGDSDYDVLGLSPDATDEEIDHAFRWLIDGEGYRVGIPLNRQWLRAHQIKTAYAALRSAAKKPAHPRTKSKAGPAPAVTKTKVLAHAARPESTRGRKNKKDRTASVSTNAGLTDSKPAKARGKAPTPGEPARVADKAQAAATPIDDIDENAVAGSNESQGPARSWRVAAAVVVGAGLILLLFWPERERQASAAGRVQSELAGKGETAGARLLVPDMADTPVPTVEPAVGATSPAKASTLEKAGEAPERAIDQEPPISQAKADMPPKKISSTVPVGTAPQWLGGGPTSADNQQGRYEGRVALQLSVERSGRVSRCAAVRGSGNAELDALTCRLVQERARFTPARDSKGRPIAGQAYTTFVWVPEQN